MVSEWVWRAILASHETVFSIGGKVSDTKEFDFGIREVASGLNRVGDECGRVYYVNGKRIFCKGGWIQPGHLVGGIWKTYL